MSEREREHERVAVLADIHGNAAALAAVLGELRRERVATVCVLGDLVGYYFEPAEAWRALGAFTTHWVRGNHEELLAASERDEALARALRAKYGEGHEVARATLDAATRAFLASLPTTRALELGATSALLCHGSPWETGAYVYPDAPDAVLARCDAAARDGGHTLVLLGHTHHPFVWRGAHALVVNPGSVGQSRVTGGVAHWALLEPRTGALRLRATPYDPSALIDECARRHPELPALAAVLRRNR